MKGIGLLFTTFIVFEKDIYEFIIKTYLGVCGNAFVFGSKINGIIPLIFLFFSLNKYIRCLICFKNFKHYPNAKILCLLCNYLHVKFRIYNYFNNSTTILLRSYLLRGYNLQFQSFKNLNF